MPVIHRPCVAELSIFSVALLLGFKDNKLHIACLTLTPLCVAYWKLSTDISQGMDVFKLFHPWPAEHDMLYMVDRLWSLLLHSTHCCVFIFSCSVSISLFIRVCMCLCVCLVAHVCGHYFGEKFHFSDSLAAE